MKPCATKPTVSRERFLGPLLVRSACRCTISILAAALFVVVGTVSCRRESAADSAVAPPVDRKIEDRNRIRAFWVVYRSAEDARVAGRWDAAAAAYREALVLDPRHEDSLYGLGNSLLELGKHDEALAAFERLVVVNDHSHRGNLQVGIVHVDPRSPLFDPAKARAAFGRAHGINREETGALLGLSEAHLLAGEVALARARVDEVLVANPTSRKGLLLRGYLRFTENDRDGAAKDLEGAAGDPFAVRAVRPDAAVASEGDTKKGSASAGQTAEVRERGIFAEALASLPKGKIEPGALDAARVFGEIRKRVDGARAPSVRQ